MKLIRRQNIWLAIVLTVNLALWIVPSDVVEQIARDRHTMLGRYSRTHFAWIVGVGVISIISFYVDWSTGDTYRKRWFQVIATLLFLGPALAVMDILMRSPEGAHYVRESFAYHRPINSEFSASSDDRPQAWRTYPNAPPGYRSINCVLRTDAWGFRNKAVPQGCEVVVLGDSFAEGSHVSDEHTWPVLLAERSDLAVYNLGMSGYDPMHYKESLRRYGLQIKPRYALCLLYEGNDFRSARSDRKRKHPRFSKRLETYFKQSPIIGAMDSLLSNTFGRINREGPVRGIEMLDWLPLTIPQGPEGRYYTFAPKQLRDMMKSREDFAHDRHWLNSRGHLEQMNRLCLENGAQLIVVYAPTKAHVTLPVLADHLPAEKVRAFTAISYKRELSDSDTFLANLTDRVDARESVVAGWCAEKAIPFLAVTGPLREAAIAGTQAYFTYDQHWTPEGHEVVADTVHRFLLSEVPKVDEPSTNG